MNWIDDFLSAFGQTGNGDSSNYFVRDQRSLVQEYVNTEGKNSQTKQDEKDEQSYHLDGQDSQTGEEFSLDITSDKLKPKNKREEEWVRREMTVTFTSRDNKDKFISASIDSLCGGRYAHLADKPLPVVAATLVGDFNTILSYADSSVASYADRITPQQAYKIARSVSENKKISYFDYEKIISKLSQDHQSQFHDLLKSASIHINYPINVLEKDIATKRANIEAARIEQARVTREKSINYYVAFVKDFQEYHLRDLPILKTRIASVLSVVDEGIKNDVIAELKKDAVIQAII
jgi:hypothetical protein